MSPGSRVAIFVTHGGLSVSLTTDYAKEGLLHQIVHKFVCLFLCFLFSYMNFCATQFFQEESREMTLPPCY